MRARGGVRCIVLRKGWNMRLYEKWVLPRLTDIAMRNKEITRIRARIVPKACGTVLEIGMGSGRNLPFYAAGVERLYGLEPSHELLAMARANAQNSAFPVEFLECPAENIPLTDGSIDTVVSTLTLCTIGDPMTALKEMRRVLKPEGVLLFAEHGLAPEPGIRNWQHRVNPLWRKVAGGCNLNRRIDRLIEAAGFRIAGLETGYAKGPRLMSYVYSGWALPAR
jgi:ubiquinone/menaquinone biosynthesis C-methylase UbiE